MSKNNTSKRIEEMNCTNCYWGGNSTVSFFYPCREHEEIELVHYYNDEKEPTVCGSLGFNVTENAEDITCPECQLALLNYYMIKR